MATTDDILQLEERRWAAQIGEDSAAMAELFADELRYTHSNGLVDTKESYMTAIQNKVFDYRNADRRDTEVQVLGNVALVTGAATIDVVAGGRELELNAHLFFRLDKLPDDLSAEAVDCEVDVGCAHQGAQD